MYPLPKSLALYTANNENVTQSVITDLTGSSVQSGNLVVDEMSYEETYYSLTSPLSCKQTWELPDMIVRNYNYFFRTTCSIPHFKALFSATENIPPIKRIPNLSYFTKLINNEKDFVLPSGILYSCLYSYCKIQRTPLLPCSDWENFLPGKAGNMPDWAAGIALRGNNFITMPIRLHSQS